MILLPVCLLVCGNLMKLDFALYNPLTKFTSDQIICYPTPEKQKQTYEIRKKYKKNKESTWRVICESASPVRHPSFLSLLIYCLELLLSIKQRNEMLKKWSKKRPSKKTK